MDFRNVNPLNVRMNYITGNLLPLAPSVSRYSIGWRLYASLMWLIQLAEIGTLIPGMLLVSREKAVGEGTLVFVLTFEVFFMAGQIQTHGKLVNRLIQKLDDILRVEDEVMKKIVTTTLKPMNAPLRYYSVAGSLCVLAWFLLSFLIIFKKKIFVYEDFGTPAAFSKEPFSTRTYVLGSSLIMIGNIHIFLKKCGLYIYITHLILIITAQYRYTAKKLATIFRDAAKRCELGQVSYEEDQWVEKCVESVVQTSHYCSTALSARFIDFLVVTVYSSGSIVEFYMLCSCVQQLQDASTEITDEAFHEKWYQFGRSVKRTFMLMTLGSKLGCRLSMCEKLNLSLPSFMTILNQSYSLALVLL